MYADPSGEGILAALLVGALIVGAYKVLSDENFHEDIRNYDPNNTAEEPVMILDVENTTITSRTKPQIPVPISM